MPLLGGVRPPVAALVVLLLAVAGITALVLGGVGVEQVPQAVRDAEAQTAADTAESVAVSIDAEAMTLRRAFDAYKVIQPTTPATALSSVLAARRSIRGAALFDPGTGRPLATSGETVPPTGLDAATLASGAAGVTVAPRLVGAGAGARVLYVARLALPVQSQNANAEQVSDQNPQQTEHWLLVLSETVPMPPVHGAGRVAWLVDRNGKVLTSAAATTGITPDQGLVRAAADAAARAGWGTGSSGSELGDTAPGTQTVAGWATVAATNGKSGEDDAANLALTALTAQPVPLAGASADYLRTALLFGAALAGVALLAGTLLTLMVQRPLLRLHLSATRLARGSAGAGAGFDSRYAEEPARPAPLPVLGEFRRIGQALEALRGQLLGECGPQEPLVRRRPGTRALVVCCALLVTAWAAPMIFVLNQVKTPKAVPATIVSDQQARTQYAAERVSQSLDQSYTDLVDVASALAGASGAKQQEILSRTLKDHAQYRSLYLLDSSGVIVSRVGKTPLRTIVHVPDGNGITNVNAAGRIPATAVYAHLPGSQPGKGGGSAVVVFGEIDVKALNGLLTRPGLGSVWLTDSRDRVLAAGVGFRAFQVLPGSGLTRLADRTPAAAGTAGTTTGAVLSSSSGLSVAAAAPVAQSGPAADLRWRIVTSEPATTLKLPEFSAQRRAMLAGLLGLTVGVSCLGWLHIIVVRPLRSLARLAERLAAGDRRTVLYPVNHDEVGSVMHNLELIRQALAERGRTGPPAAAAAHQQTHQK